MYFVSVTIKLAYSFRVLFILCCTVLLSAGANFIIKVLYFQLAVSGILITAHNWDQLSTVNYLIFLFCNCLDKTSGQKYLCSGQTRPNHIQK